MIVTSRNNRKIEKISKHKKIKKMKIIDHLLELGGAQKCFRQRAFGRGDLNIGDCSVL